MPTFTSYSQYQNDPESNKILLATVEYSELVSGWSLHTTSIYRVQMPLYTKDSTYVEARQSTTTLTVETSVGALNVNNETFFDRTNGNLFVFQDTVDPTNQTYTLTRRHHLSSEPFYGFDLPNSITTERVYYEPRLESVSPFTVDRGDPFQSLNINSRGNLVINIADKFYDQLLDRTFFENGDVRIYSVSQNLSSGGAVLLGRGKVFDISKDAEKLNLGFEDLFEFINESSLPRNSIGSGSHLGIFREGGGYENLVESDSLNKQPRYLYGRQIDVLGFCVKVLSFSAFPQASASSGRPDERDCRHQNFSSFNLYRKDSTITSISSDSQFWIGPSQGSYFTVGALVSIRRTGNVFTASHASADPSRGEFSFISSISSTNTGVSDDRITVNRAFTTNLVAVNNTISMSGIQNVRIVSGDNKYILDNQTATAPYYWIAEDGFGPTGSSLNRGGQLSLFESLNSIEAEHSVPILQIDTFITVANIFGRTSISANLDASSASDLLESSGEILLDLLQNIMSIPGIRLNTTSFLSADSIRPIHIGFSIPKSKKDSITDLKSIIEETQRSALGQLRIGRDGRLEWFVFDTITSNQSILTTVTIPFTDNDFISYQEKTDISRLNNQLQIAYKYSEFSQRYNIINRINTQNSHLFPLTNLQKRIETFIYASSSAESISSLYSLLYRRPWKIIEFETKLRGSDLLIGDRIIIEKSRKIVPRFRGTWTSAGALTFDAASPTVQEIEGHWTDSNGTLGTSFLGLSVWQEQYATPYRIAETLTRETVEIISISKDGFSTRIVATDYGGDIITSTA